jgi:hypothetical protein
MKIYRTSIQEYAREMKTMLSEESTKERSAHPVIRFFAAAVLLMISAFSGLQADAAVKQKEFASPEDAVKAFVAAAKANDDKEIIAIYGTGGKDLLYSGDPVSDKERRKRLLEAYDKKNSLVKEGEKMVIVIGENDWPFPIPLVKKGEKWIFDTKAGREEVLNRRIGQNELYTIQTMLAMVDAQREYAAKDKDGDGLLEYAEKFQSDPGKKNGLFWETKQGEEPSPLGELVADARAEGYTRTGLKQKPMPFHGYYFRMLRKQGKNAPGGAYDYVVRGSQIGGFAIVAYPAHYRNSGVMTFLVNHDGTVYQKDLGKNTAAQAKAMTRFDPDKTWIKAEEKPVP